VVHTGDYPSKSKNMSVGDPLVHIERLLRSAGWALPGDVLAHEILTTSVERFGIRETISRLCSQLAGLDPSYALEPLGAELGEDYECPSQLIRCTSEPIYFTTMPEAGDMGPTTAPSRALPIGQPTLASLPHRSVNQRSTCTRQPTKPIC
jgi:hypothetical protein